MLHTNRRGRVRRSGPWREQESSRASVGKPLWLGVVLAVPCLGTIHARALITEPANTTRLGVTAPLTMAVSAVDAGIALFLGHITTLSTRCGLVNPAKPAHDAVENTNRTTSGA